MKYEALERMEAAELELRYARCRKIMAQRLPDAAGVLIFHPVNVYYMSGTLNNGVFWLPREGTPALLVRRGLERARLESPLENIMTFRSYSELPALLADAGSPLPEGSGVVAAEMTGLSWNLANLLTSRLSNITFVPSEPLLPMTRAVKTPWELKKMRLAGQRHAQSLMQDLPPLLSAGMNEREISHKSWDVFFQNGHTGHMRMSAPGEEIFLGHVAAGDSAIYPSRYNGPVGLRGEHPAAPFMGYAGQLWKQGEPLTLDIGFCVEGYQTDKTQLYWAGARSSIPAHVQRAHDVCIELQHWLAESMKPGAIPSELYKAALERVKKSGMSEGFMALGDNKVVFIGHGIGLFIDEWPVLALGFDEPLEEGMTMALEPKIGVPGVGMVGVENTFEVTKQGAKCLTGDNFEMICIE